VPLILAASMELASVVYEPVLHSVSKAHYILITRLGTVSLLAVAILTTAQSPLGVSWLVALVQVSEYVILSLLVWWVLRNMVRTSSEQ
jgi:hypothetical protein